MDDTELNKFVVKFKSLWSSGYDAHLDIDCHAGQAWVCLRLRIGHAEALHRHRGQDHVKDSPSKQRRRARRAADRQEKNAAADKTEEAFTAGNADEENEHKKIEKSAAKEAVAAGKADQESPVVDVASVGETDKTSSDDSDAIHDEADNNTKADNDCDIYVFRYWNNLKMSEAQEAVNHIEEKLKLNFRKNRVKDCDQVYKIDDIKNLDDNEIQVKVKMKKNNWPVELSARNCQTATYPGIPVQVSIKSILR